jgi:multisubunit Na+/H+ antiporter MnhB subunit
MKFFKSTRILTLILFLIIHLPLVQAQGNRDFMRETGKIYVVVGVLLIIFVGIILNLIRLDRKLTKLEHQLKEEKNEQPH